MKCSFWGCKELEAYFANKINFPDEEVIYVSIGDLLLHQEQFKKSTSLTPLNIVQLQSAIVNGKLIIPLLDEYKLLCQMFDGEDIWKKGCNPDIPPHESISRLILSHEDEVPSEIYDDYLNYYGLNR